MDSNGSQSDDTAEGGTAAGAATAEASRTRPYVVLEEDSLLDAARALLATADVGLSAEEWQRLEGAEGGARMIYCEVGRVPSRNSAHALTQVGGSYPAGETPPLVAVSERMFKPRTVNVSLSPQVSLS